MIKSPIPPLKPSGKEVHTQTEQNSRKIRTVNGMNSFFPKQLVIQLPKLTAITSIARPVNVPRQGKTLLKDL